MTGYVLLSQAVCLVAEGLFEGGAEVTRKGPITFLRLPMEKPPKSSCDWELVPDSEKYLTLREEVIAEESGKKLFDWMISSKLKAFAIHHPNLLLSKVETSELGYLGYKSVFWAISAIRKNKYYQYLEDIKVDPKEVKRLIEEEQAAAKPGKAEQAVANQAAPQRKRRGRKSEPDEELWAEMHKLVMEGSKRYAAAKIVVGRATGKGSVVSKVRRLVDGYNRHYSGRTTHQVEEV